MIKKGTLILGLFLFNISFGQTIEGKVVYNATLNTDVYINELKNNTEISEFFKKAKLRDALNARPMNFFLLFKGNESLYQAEFDLNKQRDLGLGINLVGMVAGISYTSYTNLKTKENIRKSFWMDNVIINVKPLVWELTKENRIIDQYICYKAITTLKEENYRGGLISDEITAWYTLQIPVGFGVQNFGGLPGLTIELTQNTERGILFYKAIKIELNPKEEINIKKPKGKGITHKEFIELTKR
jgi:GLPGLI family protein